MGNISDCYFHRICKEKVPHDTHYYTMNLNYAVYTLEVFELGHTPYNLGSGANHTAIFLFL